MTSIRMLHHDPASPAEPFIYNYVPPQTHHGSTSEELQAELSSELEVRNGDVYTVYFGSELLSKTLYLLISVKLCSWRLNRFKFQEHMHSGRLWPLADIWLWYPLWPSLLKCKHYTREWWQRTSIGSINKWWEQESYSETQDQPHCPFPDFQGCSSSGILKLRLANHQYRSIL